MQHLVRHERDGAVCRHIHFIKKNFSLRVQTEHPPGSGDGVGAVVERHGVRRDDLLPERREGPPQLHALALPARGEDGARVAVKRERRRERAPRLRVRAGGTISHPLLLVSLQARRHCQRRERLLRVGEGLNSDGVFALNENRTRRADVHHHSRRRLRVLGQHEDAVHADAHAALHGGSQLQIRVVLRGVRRDHEHVPEVPVARHIQRGRRGHSVPVLRESGEPVLVLRVVVAVPRALRAHQVPRGELPHSVVVAGKHGATHQHGAVGEGERDGNILPLRTVGGKQNQLVIVGRKPEREGLLDSVRGGGLVEEHAIRVDAGKRQLQGASVELCVDLKRYKGFLVFCGRH